MHCTTLRYVSLLPYFFVVFHNYYLQYLAERDEANSLVNDEMPSYEFTFDYMWFYVLYYFS